MPNCHVKGCSSHSRHCSKTKNGITFHRFPVDPVRHEIWSRILRKQRGEPYYKYQKFSTVCSLHFAADCFYTTKKGRSKIKETAVPSLLLHPAKPSKKQSPKESNNADNPQQEEDNLNDVDISDLQSIFDSPLVVQLKSKLKKYEIRHSKQVKIIKRLRTEVNRLRKRNFLLQTTVKNLKARVFDTGNESNDEPELHCERIFFKEQLVVCEYGESPTKKEETSLSTYFTKFSDAS